MDKCFKGKRILVTGGCQGIGQGLVTELWKQGANVVAISNLPENLKKLKQQYPSIEVATVDLRNWEKTREIVDSLGAFDGLVNNAGVAIIEPFLEATPGSFDESFSLNVKAIMNVSQIIAKKMIENKIKGAIVNVSSQASKAALKDHVVYCASKGAVDSMTRVMALELGPYGIRVNTVNPTVIMTEMGRKIWSEPSKSEAMLSKIPLGRNRVDEVPEFTKEALCAIVALLTAKLALEIAPGRIRFNYDTSDCNWTKFPNIEGKKSSLYCGFNTEIHLIDGVYTPRVLVLCPYVIETRIRSKEFGEVHEVVSVIMFLLSDGASMISGVQLPVDGGFLAT